jgi:hypothetical protein
MEYRSTIRLKLNLTLTADVKLVFGGDVFNIEKNSSKVKYEVNLMFATDFGKSKIEMSSEKPFRINEMVLDTHSILKTVLERSTYESNVINPDKKLESWVITPLQLDSINHHTIFKDWHY